MLLGLGLRLGQETADRARAPRFFRKRDSWADEGNSFIQRRNVGVEAKPDETPILWTVVVGISDVVKVPFKKVKPALQWLLTK